MCGDDERTHYERVLVVALVDIADFCHGCDGLSEYDRNLVRELVAA
jgi:hypothetical protein